MSEGFSCRIIHSCCMTTRFLTVCIGIKEYGIQFRLLLLFTYFFIFRIDRLASGLLIFARTKMATSRFNKQFMVNSIQKEYVARVKVSIIVPGPLL